MKNDIENIKVTDERINNLLDGIIKNTNCLYKKRELFRVAALELKLLDYINEFKLDTLTIQCWTSIQKYIGITPCLTNSRLTSQGYPVACEGDVNNSLAMLIQRKMTFDKKTPMLLDMLVMHPEENDLLLVWHCGNVYIENKMDGKIANVMPQCPWEQYFGRERAAASIEFPIKSGEVTINSLVEHNGVYKLLNINAELINKEQNLRGSWSWAKIIERDAVYDLMVNKGFTHHVSIIHENLTEIIKQFCKYLNIELVSLKK